MAIAGIKKIAVVLKRNNNPNAIPPHIEAFIERGQCGIQKANNIMPKANRISG